VRTGEAERRKPMVKKIACALLVLIVATAGTMATFAYTGSGTEEIVAPIAPKFILPHDAHR